MKRVLVCCPGNAVTGGPELLHQFVDALRNKNVDARILYFPFNEEFKIPEAYKKYDVCTFNYNKINSDDVVVLPEVSTGLVSFFKKNKVYLWWLSVDNYFGTQKPNGFRGKLRHYFDILKGSKLSLNEIKERDIFHLVQSKYAKDFLLKNGIESTTLTDYLNEEHLEQEVDYSIKIKQIAYNPKKGFEYTRRLIEKNSDIHFIPIQNLTPSEVKSLLQKSMIYIDFGNHPGKDCFPREAAMAGCCIITNTAGSAANNIDVCISQQFKIDCNTPFFEKNFINIVRDIFGDFERNKCKFDEYRLAIYKEKKLFHEQVAQFVNGLK